MRKLLLLLLLSGCMQKPAGPFYDVSSVPNKGTATIVVYRNERKLMNQDGLLNVNINGVVSCNLVNGAYTEAKNIHGDATISVTGWDEPGTARLTINTKPNNIYYIRLDEKTERSMAGFVGGFVGKIAEEIVSDKGGPTRMVTVLPDTAKFELGLKRQYCQPGLI